MGSYEQTIARYLKKVDVAKSVKILPKARKFAAASVARTSSTPRLGYGFVFK
jgi:hypothetical protein